MLLMRDELRLPTTGRAKEDPSLSLASSLVRKQSRRSILPKKSSLGQIINDDDDAVTPPEENKGTVLFAGRQKRGRNHRCHHYHTSSCLFDIDESAWLSRVANGK